MPNWFRGLCLAVACAVNGVGWGQAPPPGTYTFISGAGVGTAPFTVSGFSTSLGGSIGAIHIPNCSGLHVHGTFNGFADPNSGGCGHGIIALFVPPPTVSGGSLPGGSVSNAAGAMPTTAGGQLALTRPAGFEANAGELFLVAFAGLGPKEVYGNEAANLANVANLFNALNVLEPTIVAPWDRTSAPTPAFGANTLQTTLADPAQRVLTSPAATSWLEEFAAFDDRAADGYRRDADKTAEQADEWRKLADDARRDAERNRQRADDARKDGRDADARNWDDEAERDDARGEERDQEARRLDGWSDEARQREAAARDQAQERRDAAERAREAVRQAARDRAQAARLQAEEKARLAQEARNARLLREQNERDARQRALEERVRRAAAQEAEKLRQRQQAERDYRSWLDAQNRERDLRARGGSTDADAFAVRKKKEEEETTWADYVVGFFDSGEGEMAKDKIKDTLQDKAKDKALDLTGIAGKIEDAGVGDALGKLGEGIDQIKKIKALGDSMEAELQRQPGLRSRIENRIDTLSDPKSRAPRAPLTSGSLYGSEMFGTVARMVDANK